MVFVIITALGMFLPVVYGSIGPLKDILGDNILLKSAAIVVFGWVLAYLTFEESESGRRRGKELTAS